MGTESATPGVRALLFDVFGTVVDWHSSVVAELQQWGRARGLERDWTAFTEAWRRGYPRAMDRVRSGELPWLNVDALHRMILDELFERFELPPLGETEADQLSRAWHRLAAWPDSAPGLVRLRRRYTTATLSNGGVALLVNLAKHAGLEWDAVLSAELFRHYKPDRQAYLGAVQLLGLAPEQVAMVAAHRSDLDAAASAGLRTAFIARPLEWGASIALDTAPSERFNWNARDLLDLSEQLCS